VKDEIRNKNEITKFEIPAYRQAGETKNQKPKTKNQLPVDRS
jgi:hypothetical protein